MTDFRYIYAPPGAGKTYLVSQQSHLEYCELDIPQLINEHHSLNHRIILTNNPYDPLLQQDTALWILPDRACFMKRLGAKGRSSTYPPYDEVVSLMSHTTGMVSLNNMHLNYILVSGSLAVSGSQGIIRSTSHNFLEATNEHLHHHVMCPGSMKPRVHLNTTSLIQYITQDPDVLLIDALPECAPTSERHKYTPYNLAFTDLCTYSCTISIAAAFEWSTYNKPPKALGGIFQVHPIHVLQAVRHDTELLSVLYWVISIHLDMHDYEIAAIILWWALLPLDIRNHFLMAGLHTVHMLHSAQSLAARLEVCRQNGAACSCSLGASLLHFLRKFPVLKGRSIGSVDVTLEATRMLPDYSYREYPGEGHNPRHEYLTRLYQQLVPLTDRIVSKLVKNHRDNTIKTWWQNRAQNIPAGSSSERALLHDIIEKDSRLTKDARPSKKTVIECLSPNTLANVLTSHPIAIARRSAKNETGRKHRALYAQDDKSFLVSAYASHGVETAMNIDGMCPQQRPADILDWQRTHWNMKNEDCWLSADFTDFNKEHSTAELVLINLAFTRSWMKQTASPGSITKSMAAVWTAYSHLNRYYKDEDSNYHPVFSGLWSGHRDTARDNTILHKAYQGLALEWLDNNFPEWGLLKRTYICGDDEDSLFSSPKAAACYYLSLVNFSWHLNPCKQLCGATCHEFLQKMICNDQCASGSVCSMVAALCSGQWYKEPGLHQDMAIPALTDQCWELVVRQADPSTVWRICYRLLNAYMQVRSPRGNLLPKDGSHPRRKKLEWWIYRFHAQQLPVEYGVSRTSTPSEASHPMWGPSSSAKKPPAVFYEELPMTNLPALASQSMVEKNAHIFQSCGASHLIGTYTNMLKNITFGKLFHHHIQARKEEYIHKHWPERQTKVDVETEVALFTERITQLRKQLVEDSETVTNVLRTPGASVLPLSDGELLRRAGSDITLFNLLGGWGNEQLLAALGITFCDRRVGTSWYTRMAGLQSAWMLDPALRCFIFSQGVA